MTDNETGSGASAAVRPGHRIVPALLVVGVGVIFLCGNLGVQLPFFDWANWWAWFILAGAAWPLSEAWARYRAVGAVDGAVAQSLLGALAIVIVAMIFILGLSWAKWWPLFVIYGGLCMLVREPRRRRRDGVR
jgi:hypothetical protein